MSVLMEHSLLSSLSSHPAPCPESPFSFYFHADSNYFLILENHRLLLALEPQIVTNFYEGFSALDQKLDATAEAYLNLPSWLHASQVKHCPSDSSREQLIEV